VIVKYGEAFRKADRLPLAKLGVYGSMVLDDSLLFVVVVRPRANHDDK